ncbi:xanthine dehydrogenase family protein subunit M [Kiloniella laminariae]|uniref:Xanthine dehydrogenase family protein subunit M n=1 Tax=Kiloniella laminariae TaxID=454162 RepID=A0ABT4LNA6_9PROT|nr:xanthine dehydrogenase family protein subunit M [Kiloniella laminariae]MCZ4281427.1 xanthine dehydrogenase family protein subunit M [Kiloniella laminariae]
MYHFEYQRPATLDEAVALLKEDCKLLAGGQTLLPTMKQRLAQPEMLVDLGAIETLRGVCPDDDKLAIGAMTTHAEVASKADIPALACLAAGIGDPQVRNRGTIGGSVANNDPAADYPAAVLGLNAQITTNKRVIAADDFFVDLFETALEENEIIINVTFPRPQAAAYVKFDNPASRYAIVGVFVAKTGGGVRVAVTGAGPCVFRHKDLETALTSNFSAQSVDTVTVSATGLNNDLHASAEYRANLIKVLTKRAVAQIGG